MLHFSCRMAYLLSTMLGIHLVWTSVFFISSLPIAETVRQGSSGEQRCTNKCKNQEKFLNCVNYDISQIPSATGCQKVFSLNLVGNRIESLEKGAFASFSGLNRKLSLKRNGLSLLDSYAFANISKLETLELDENNIANLSNNTFEGLSGLKHLSLSSNRMVVIQRGFFESLISVEILLLGNNTIESIQSSAFEALRNLEKLDLSRNRIERLLDDTFSGLIKLRKLNMSHNFIWDLEINAFKDLTGLTELNLSYNKIVSLSAIHDLRLSVLDLSSNRITGINDYLNGQLQSQFEFVINVSNNPLHCDCSIQPLYLWYKDRAIVGGEIARCSTPAYLNATPLSEASSQDICPGYMPSTSQPPTTTFVEILLNDGIVRPDEEPKFSYSTLLMGISLGLLCLVLVLVMSSAVYRTYKRISRSTPGQMEPVEQMNVRTPSPSTRLPQEQAVQLAGSGRIMSSRPPARLPEEPARAQPSRPPIASGPRETPSRHRQFRHRLSSLYTRGYFTRVIKSNSPDICITAPSSPSAEGHFRFQVPRVPSHLTHTARQNHFNDRSGSADHLSGCQMRSADGMFPSNVSMSCTCAYLSIDGADTVTQPYQQPQGLPRKPRDQLTLPAASWWQGSCQYNPSVIPNLAPDTPEYGLKMGRDGKVQILPLEEILRERRPQTPVDWDETPIGCSRPPSPFYCAV
ncbi:leucine-rich repeat transmembrane neuronal protein 4-like [Acanthaster planci]|uniref:Leucine-rich repeat transmembrane neuronal protein 4-like n=1 Tax=Acanthaster planci TaxID=133434 RepID=A0A8B7ZWZ9_ACAPL|nr:leucine-rich repeat transmembrane neuronal protein 4-like [Acanthaster planci]